jgi:hypothetical protein
VKKFLFNETAISFSTRRRRGQRGERTYSNQSGLTMAANPKLRAAVAMKRSRRVQATVARMRTPATATDEKRKTVRPPMVEEGIATKTAPNCKGRKTNTLVWK